MYIKMYEFDHTSGIIQLYNNYSSEDESESKRT